MFMYLMYVFVMLLLHYDCALYHHNYTYISSIINLITSFMVLFDVHVPDVRVCMSCYCYIMIMHCIIIHVPTLVYSQLFYNGLSEYGTVYFIKDTALVSSYINVH